MDNNSKKPNNKVNMPKFNLNWMYMIIALMLLGLYFDNGSSSVTKNISYDEFQQYAAFSHFRFGLPARTKVE